MNRFEIIEIIGKEFLSTNLENGEFSFKKALKEQGKSIDKNLISSQNNTEHSNIDIRFEGKGTTILVETKKDFDKNSLEDDLVQLQAYVNYEKVLTGNKSIAILANTDDDRIKVWWGSNLTIDESHQIKNQYKLKTFDEYADIYLGTKNDRESFKKHIFSQ